MFAKVSPELDTSTNSLVFDRSKCAMCQSCVRACKTIAGMNIVRVLTDDDGNEVISAVGGKKFQDTNCIKCGQCTLACGPGALKEKDDVPEVSKVLKNPNGKITCCQVAPAVRIAISEAVGLPPGTISTGRLVTALKKLGFQYVFDTNYSADMTIIEEATELVNRLTKGTGPLPMFTSCCPAWINFVEQSRPDLIPQLSTCRSPMSMLAPLIKTEFAAMKKVTADDIYSVAIMPCIAKKDECERPQLRLPGGQKCTDKVISTRELGRWIKKAKINFKSLPETPFDAPYAKASGGGAIFCATGGVMEAAIRTAHNIITGNNLKPVEFKPVRGADKGIKLANLNIKGKDVTFGVVHGIANTQKLLKRIKDKDPELANLLFVEVMACPGGCVCGGGTTRPRTKKIIQKRLDATYKIDQTSEHRNSHENPDLMDCYKRFLGEPNGHKAHEFLHTHYSAHKK